MNTILKISCLLVLFFSIIYVHAQDFQTPKYGIELHLLEPSMLVLSRSISNNGKWHATLGGGFAGVFYTRYLSRPLDIRNGYRFNRFIGSVIDVSIRRYFFIFSDNRFGVIFQSGVHCRNLGLKYPSPFVGGPIITYYQVLPYLRTGVFYRPSLKLELGISAGIGLHVYDITGISEFMTSGYVGYKISRKKS